MLNNELLLSSSSSAVGYPPPSDEYPFWFKFDPSVIGSGETFIETFDYGTFNECAQTGILQGFCTISNDGISYDDEKGEVNLSLFACGKPTLPVGTTNVYWAISPVYPSNKYRIYCLLFYDEEGGPCDVTLQNEADLAYKHEELFRAIVSGAPWTIIE